MHFSSKTLLRTVVLAAIFALMVLPNGSQQKRLCGRALSNALTTICGGNFNVMDKKSGHTVDLDEMYDQSYFDEDYRFVMPPFLNNLGNGVIVPKVRRLRHGVSDECCKKSCSYRELASYCRTE